MYTPFLISVVTFKTKYCWLAKFHLRNTTAVEKLKKQWYTKDISITIGFLLKLNFADKIQIFYS